MKVLLLIIIIITLGCNNVLNAQSEFKLKRSITKEDKIELINTLTCPGTVKFIYSSPSKFVKNSIKHDLNIKKERSIREIEKSIELLNKSLKNTTDDADIYTKLADEYDLLDNKEEMSIDCLLKAYDLLKIKEKQNPNDEVVTNKLVEVCCLLQISMFGNEQLNEKRNLINSEGIKYSKRNLDKNESLQKYFLNAVLLGFSGDITGMHNNFTKIQTFSNDDPMYTVTLLFLSTFAIPYAILDKKNTIQIYDKESTHDLLYKGINFEKFIKSIEQSSDKIMLTSWRYFTELTFISFKILLKDGESKSIEFDKPLKSLTDEDLKILDEMERFYLEQINKNNLNKKDVNKWLSTIYLIKRDFNKMLYYFEKAYLSKPNSEELLFLVYCHSIKSNKHNKSHELANIKLKQSPTEEDYLTKYLIYMSEDKFNDAEKFVKKALSINKSNSKSKLYLSIVFIKQNKFEDAFKILSDIKINKENVNYIADIYRVMGISKLLQDSFDDAFYFFALSMACDEDGSKAKVLLDKYYENGSQLAEKWYNEK